jgi:hypothetical protein
MKRLLSVFAILLAPLAIGQTPWPVYPVHAPTQIYKILIDNGSGVAILATSDGSPFLGVGQNGTVTSTGFVNIQTTNTSQVQANATTPVTMGELVTSDAHGNLSPFTPAGDGNQHCYLGYVAGLGTGSGAAGTFVYVAIQPSCAHFYTVSGGAVTSVFGRTGVVVATSGDYAVAQVTGAAPLASPTFTGTVTLPATLDTPAAMTLAGASTLTWSTGGAVTNFSLTSGLGGGTLALLSSGAATLSGGTGGELSLSGAVILNSSTAGGVTIKDTPSGGSESIVLGPYLAPPNSNGIAITGASGSEIFIDQDFSEGIGIEETAGANGSIEVQVPGTGDGDWEVQVLASPGAYSVQTNEGWYSHLIMGSDHHALTSRCAAVGTSANPSVVACGAFAGGAFSCATAASGGTCVVDATSVCVAAGCIAGLTTTSTIFVSQVTDEGSILGVTCNTSPVTAMVSARSNGVSFTVTLGTFTTNPVCFNFAVE